MIDIHRLATVHAIRIQLYDQLDSTGILSEGSKESADDLMENNDDTSAHGSPAHRLHQYMMMRRSNGHDYAEEKRYGFCFVFKITI